MPFDKRQGVPQVPCTGLVNVIVATVIEKGMLALNPPQVHDMFAVPVARPVATRPKTLTMVGAELTQGQTPLTSIDPVLEFAEAVSSEVPPMFTVAGNADTVMLVAGAQAAEPFTATVGQVT